jgi:O-antigen ligase
VREGFWKAAVAMAKDHPFGVGVGNFPFYYPLYAPLSGNYEYHIAISDSHNLFLDAAAETGVIGLMLLVGFFATLVYSGIRSVASAHSSADDRVRDVGLALAAALGAGILMHLTFSYAYYPFEWVIAALVGSLPRVVARRAAGAAP